MAVEKGLNPFTWEASASLATKQFYLVNQASDGQIQVVTTRGDFCMGVLQNDPAAEGRAANVQTLGGTITKVVASSTAATTVAVGDKLIASVVGRAVKGATGGTAYIVGRAMEAIATTGLTRTIPMFITHEGQMSSA